MLPCCNVLIKEVHVSLQYAQYKLPCLASLCCHALLRTFVFLKGLALCTYAKLNCFEHCLTLLFCRCAAYHFNVCTCTSTCMCPQFLAFCHALLSNVYNLYVSRNVAALCIEHFLLSCHVSPMFTVHLFSNKHYLGLVM